MVTTTRSCCEPALRRGLASQLPAKAQQELAPAAIHGWRRTYVIRSEARGSGSPSQP
jgi:hypothetical protein